jgi:hypothetical protein
MRFGFRQLALAKQNVADLVMRLRMVRVELDFLLKF